MIDFSDIEQDTRRFPIYRHTDEPNPGQRSLVLDAEGRVHTLAKADLSDDNALAIFFFIDPCTPREQILEGLREMKLPLEHIRASLRSGKTPSPEMMSRVHEPFLFTGLGLHGFVVRDVAALLGRPALSTNIYEQYGGTEQTVDAILKMDSEGWCCLVDYLLNRQTLRRLVEHYHEQQLIAQP